MWGRVYAGQVRLIRIPYKLMVLHLFEKPDRIRVPDPTHLPPQPKGALLVLLLIFLRDMIKQTLGHDPKRHRVVPTSNTFIFYDIFEILSLDKLQT